MIGIGVLGFVFRATCYFLRLCEAFMETHCRVSLVTKRNGCDHGYDAALRTAAAQAKA